MRLILHFQPLFRCLQFIFVRSPEAVLHQLEWEAASRQQLLLWGPTSQPTPLLLESPCFLLIISTHQCSDFINSHRILGLLLNIFVVVAVVDYICWLRLFISILCSAPKHVAFKTTVHFAITLSKRQEMRRIFHSAGLIQLLQNSANFSSCPTRFCHSCNYFLLY